MLLPYSASSTRRSIFSALLMVAVLAPAVCVVVGLLGARAPWLALLSLGIGVATSTLLCIWCAVYVREEPGLVRIALIWGAVLFLLLTVAFLWAAIAPSHLGPSKQMRSQADIQGIRTMLLSYHDTNRFYPSTDEGLNVLVPKLMEELPKDAWGTPYVYRCPGRANPLGYDLFSAGPDHIPDTADDDWGR
jgi:general secretion pathway protein G